MSMNIEFLTKMIDLSCVQAYHTYDDIKKMVAVAKKYNILCVFTLPAHIPYVKQLLKDRPDILIGGPVGFPDGSMTTSGKLFTVNEQIEVGVNELDMVLNITWLRSGKYDLLENDIRQVIGSAGSLPVKVILECPYLTDDEITTACEIAVGAGASFIKTGTGWTREPSSLDQIKLICNTVQGRCKVKVAGGIRTLSQIEEMIDLGVQRFGIGTSSAISILSKCAQQH